MQRGFSLVELSIVLVILGLLTGGILAGQSLIRASELRAVTAEYQRYIAATQTFRDKYFSIPGDFRDATRFWLRMTNTGDCVTNSAATVNAAGSCDGNGDGVLANPGAVSQSGESFQTWRQLALAGLIEGTYSGQAGSGGVLHSVIGTNTPRSKLGNAGWSTYYLPPGWAGNAEWFRGDFLNMFTFGIAATNSINYGAVLKPEEAWNIDTKMDDGRPALGGVISLYNNNCTDAADQNATTASYDLDNTAVVCRLVFPRSL